MKRTTTSFSLKQGLWYGLSGTDIRLLEQLDYYYRRFGRAFPSQKKLAEILCVSERTVRRSVKHLRDLGLLAVHHLKYRNRLGQIRSRSNSYKVLTFVGAKIRSLFVRLTGRPQKASPNGAEEKKESSDLSFVKNKALREALKRFAKLGERKI